MQTRHRGRTMHGRHEARRGEKQPTQGEREDKGAGGGLTCRSGAGGRRRRRGCCGWRPRSRRAGMKAPGRRPSERRRQPRGSRGRHRPRRCMCRSQSRAAGARRRACTRCWRLCSRRGCSRCATARRWSPCRRRQPGRLPIEKRHTSRCRNSQPVPSLEHFPTNNLLRRAHSQSLKVVGTRTGSRWAQARGGTHCNLGDYMGWGAP